MTANRAVLADGTEVEYHTAETVKLRMEEAADTLKRLRVHGLRPSEHRTHWPEVVQDFWEAYGSKDEEPKLGAPRPAAIDRMDEAMTWLFQIQSAQARGVVWGKACGLSTRRMARILGISRHYVDRLYNDALENVVRRVNGLA